MFMNSSPLRPLEETHAEASALRSDVIAELSQLVAIPSCAHPGHPEKPIREAANAVVALLEHAGATDASLVETSGSPLVRAFLPSTTGDSLAPTVLLYAHYDVQPVLDPDDWETNPWELTESGGRFAGRGAADDKSGVVVIANVVKLIGKNAPVNLKVLIEGEEEIGSGDLPHLLSQQPDLVSCDAMFIVDSGNLTVTSPALDVALRGVASCMVTVETLDHAPHSGLFGGAAPDALAALMRMLTSLHHDDGRVAVSGLHEYEWPDPTSHIDESEFRRDAGTKAGTHLIGSGSLVDRLWAKPAISVLGIDAPSTGAPNALVPTARAKVSLRVAPGGNPRHELEVVMNHLRAVTPWGAAVTFAPIEYGAPFAANTDHQALRSVARIMEEMYKHRTSFVGSGGSIPIVDTIARISPHAATLLLGPQDLEKSRIHATNESVDMDEIIRMIAILTTAISGFGNLETAPATNSAALGDQS